MDVNLNCHCSCGKNEFNVSGKPLFRIFCHCSICQGFYKAPYADITIFRNRDVLKPSERNLDLKTIWIPPFIQRGTCVSCGKPAILYLKMFPMPRLVIVPSTNIYDKALVPEPSLHIFYDNRVCDIEDELPKYNGYLNSQIAMGHTLMTSLLHWS